MLAGECREIYNDIREWEHLHIGEKCRSDHVISGGWERTIGTGSSIRTIKRRRAANRVIGPSGSGEHLHFSEMLRLDAQ